MKPIATIASHGPLLAACIVAAPPGGVLELGAGAYSTALIHYLARVAGRAVRTIDSDAAWIARFAGLQSPGHDLTVDADPVSSPVLALPWAVAFVDGKHGERAGCLRALHHVPLVVVHDTEPERLDKYPGVGVELAKYAYRLDLRMPMMERNQTSVVSDLCEPRVLLKL